MKKNSQEKATAPRQVEPWWNELKTEYFSFYKSHFRDSDGYAMSPDWNPSKAGMEASSLKKIITFLREIAEGKNKEWSKEYAIERLNNFLERAYHKDSRIKYFYCALLNKNKADILCSEFNPTLAKKILEAWYFDMPNYVRDYEKDKAAATTIIAFLKQQYVLSSIPFTEESVIGSCRLIFSNIKDDEFWSQKTLKSIANNFQEFVNRIKNGRRKGNQNNWGVNENPNSFNTNNSKLKALANWGVKAPKGDK